MPSRRIDWLDLLEEREPLGNELRAEERDARAVDARARVAGHDLAGDRVAADREHDRLRDVRVDERLQDRPARRDDHVGPFRDDDRHELPQALGRALAAVVVDRQVAALGATSSRRPRRKFAIDGSSGDGRSRTPTRCAARP
jgi:hypothetical protein